MASSINPHSVVQEIQLEPDAYKMTVPFAMSISGPSQSKTCSNTESKT